MNWSNAALQRKFCGTTIMNLDRWHKVKQIFHEALAQPPEAWAPFVTEACGSDTQLCAEVERLLDAHDKAGSFIEHSPLAGTNIVAGEMIGQMSLTGTQLGRYEIGRLLGAGGMGISQGARTDSPTSWYTEPPLTGVARSGPGRGSAGGDR